MSKLFLVFKLLDINNKNWRPHGTMETFSLNILEVENINKQCVKVCEQYTLVKIKLAKYHVQSNYVKIIMLLLVMFLN